MVRQNILLAFAGKLTAGILIVAFISSCGTSRSADSQRGNSNTDQAPVIAVTTARVEARNIPAYIQATGSLTAHETSSVAPKVAGKVANVAVNVGQFVSQGALIAKIDDRDARLELVSAQ